MSKIKVGKLTHGLFIMFALLAFLTIAAAPAAASGYQLSGVVHYRSTRDTLKSPEVDIYKWDGSSWAYHGVAYADECGTFTYDTGSPGYFQGSVGGYYIVKDGFYYCGVEYAIDAFSGIGTVEVNNSYAYMTIRVTEGW
jgi:hypothetical protein